MLNRPPAWLPPGVSGYDSLYADIVERAVADRGLPDVLDRFAYGTRFPLELNHPVFGSMPLLGKLSGPGKVPQRGNGNTVCQAGASFGPSQRLTVDFGELDRSTSNVVTGQSGQMLSEHYMDQFPLWLEGRTLELPFSPEAVEAAKSHRLTLLPR
jgi:penicillin amidase